MRWAPALVGLALMSPSLPTGLVADDYFHCLMTRSQPGIPGLARSPFDLFRFATGDANDARQFMEQGIFPWWADPNAKLGFFRPLASFSHYLDYTLWPSSTGLMHGQNLLWFGALLVVVRALFDRICTRAGVALMASVIFSLDDAHAPTVSWIANRNMVMAATFSLSALLAHRAWREGGPAWLAGISHLAFMLGLGSAEAAVATVGYFVAYAAIVESGGLAGRAKSLAGYALILLAWRVLYEHMGYGVRGSGLYFDPGHELRPFLSNALTRLPVLVLATFGLPWAELWDVYPLIWPRGQAWVLAFACAFSLLLVWLFAERWRREPRTRFWILGCGLSLLPCGAAFPHDRLLLIPSLGASALLATSFVTRGAESSWAKRLVIAGLLGVHIVLAPALALFRASRVTELDRRMDIQDRTIPSGVAVSDKVLVLLNPPVDPFAAYFAVKREAQGEARPAHVYWLSSGVSALHVWGIDPHTLRIRAERGFVSGSSERMLRSPRAPFRLGQRIALRELAIEVKALTGDRRPLEIEVHFEKALSDPALLLMRWDVAGFSRWIPPAPGAEVHVPRVDMAAALFG